MIKAQVMAPPDAHKFVTQSAIIDLKLRLRVVPASNASHEFQMITRAISCDMEFPGLWILRWEGVRIADFFERNSGYERYTLSAVAVALEQTKSILVYRVLDLQYRSTYCALVFRQRNPRPPYCLESQFLTIPYEPEGSK